MRDVPRKYGEWVVRWRWPVLIGSLLLTVGLGAFATAQRYYNPYEIWFLPNDPALVAYRQLLRQYGEDDFVIIAFREPAGIFTNKALGAILDLTERLEATPFVDKVSSVANYQYIRARVSRGGEEELLIEDLVRREELPLSAEEVRRREEIALGETPIVGSLLSAKPPDGGPPTTTGVVARVIINDEEPENAVRIVESVRAITREIEAKYGYRLYAAGVPVVEHAFATFGKRETLTFTSALLGTVAVLLGVVFRRARGVLLPCGVVVLALAPALGIMALARIWLNPLTTIIPQILITVAIAEAIHLVAGFFELRRQGLPRDAAVIQTVEENFKPCMVTSLTTAIGFASLMAGTVVPMRQLGFGACLAALFAWLLSFTFLPAALAIWPDRRVIAGVMPGAASRREAWLDRVLDGCARFAADRPWSVVAGTLAVFAALMVFVAQIRVETSYKNMFKPQTELRQGLAFIEGNLGGSEDMEISIDSGRSDGVKDPAFLRKLETMQAFLAAQPQVSHTFSVVDILERMSEVMHNNDPAFHRVPESAELSAQYLLLYTLGSRKEDLKDRIDVDNRWTRLSARVRAQSSSETLAMGERVRRFIRERFPELRANVTGKALLYTGLQEEMAANTVSSFATAFLPITLVLTLVFRSLLVGVLSMIPNLLPILGVAGLMGLLGIPLDPGSAMVASIGIGIIVDDNVHFFSKYLGNRAAGASAPESVTLTLQEVGRPVIYTTFILAFGFSLFVLSQFNFIAYFGQLATYVIILALITDLLLSPALVIIFDLGRRRVTKDLAAARRGASKGLPLILTALVLLPAPAGAGPADDRGLAIMTEQDRINSGFQTEITLYKMVLMNAQGDRSERIMEFRTLEGVTEGDKTLIIFKAPPDISGTGLLTHQNRIGDDDQWLYLPALRRVKRIASANRGSSFVGSEFTYEDLTPLELNKYRHKYLRDDMVGDQPVWVVEAVPQFKDSGYSRMEMFVRKDNHQTARTNFYEKKGDQLKKIGTFEGWSKVDGKWWRARSVRMDNTQTRKSTLLETVEAKIGVSLSARDFTARALEK
jgi:predicted RND superfamily exporter protein